MRGLRDIDLRTALHAKILRRHRGDPDTLVLDEFGLRHGEARVDIGVVNGRIHGFEIKSDRDTLARLPGQVAIYSEVLDRVTLVVGERHARHAAELVPEWWGVKLAVGGSRGGVHFRGIKPTRENPRLNPTAVAELLWRSEALSVLQRRGLGQGMLSKTRRQLYARLAAVLTLDEIRDEVRAALKARPYWRADPSRT
jgi:hypothetical protein